jgi:predicted CXXCH cytochrome family protein
MRVSKPAWLIAVSLFAAAVSVDFKAAVGGQVDAKYIGPKMCIACHKGTHAEAVTSWKESAHADALWGIEEEGTGTRRVAADFSQAPPFPREQIAYVLGAGRKYQSFLDKDLKVLPGEWDVKKNAWRPREAADAARDCLGCHTTGFDPQTRRWTAPGVTCEMCHGPGSEHIKAKDKKAGIVMPDGLDPARRAMVCGQCHAHGKSRDGCFAFPHGYRPGDDLNEFFVLAADIPEGTVNSQHNDMAQGNGKHLAAGTVCTTCHVPHGSGGNAPAMLRGPVNQVCLNPSCHGGKLSGPQHSEEALKATTCVICHMPESSHVFAVPRATQ